MPVFARVGSWSKMATPVVSEPVPAVVGIAISGRTGPGTGMPRPIGMFTKSRNSCDECVAYRLAALAVSMVEPPPTATYASKPPARAHAAAAENDASVGSTRTSEKTARDTPAASIDASAVENAAVRNTPASVKIATRVAPSARRSCPTSAVTPRP